MSVLTGANKVNQNSRPIPLLVFTSFLVIAGLWAAILLAFPGIKNYPIIQDAPIFHYIAQRILLGDVPYRDILDINLPGIYFLHIFVLLFFGKGDTSWAGFYFLWLGLTALAAGWYCWRFSRLSAILAAALIVSQNLSLSAYNIGQRDFFLVLFLLIALELFTQEIEGDHKRYFSSGRLLGAGFCIGAATLIKPTPLVLIFVFIGILLVYKKNTTEQAPGVGLKRILPNKEALIKVLWISAGTAILPVLVFAWLALRGGLDAFFTIMLQYNLSIYSALYRIDTAGLVEALFVKALPFVLSFPFLLFGLLLLRNKTENVRMWFAILAVAFGCFHFFYQGKGWTYQIIPLYIFCSVLEAIVFGKLIQGKTLSQILALFMILPTVLVLASFMLVTHYYRSDNPVQELKPAVPLLVSDLKMLRLTPQDGIQVMDAVEGGIHALFLLDHPQSTRYIYDSLFIRSTDKPLVREIQRDFIRQLQNDPPRFIVVFLKGPFPQENGMERYSSFPQFLDLVKTNYALTLQREYYFIFERKTVSLSGIKQ